MPKVTTIELQEEIKTIKEAISNVRAETEKLEKENAELRNRNNKLIERLKCESDQPGWCEVCAIVYDEEDPCQFH